MGNGVLRKTRKLANCKSKVKNTPSLRLTVKIRNPTNFLCGAGGMLRFLVTLLYLVPTNVYVMSLGVTRRGCATYRSNHVFLERRGARWARYGPVDDECTPTEQSTVVDSDSEAFRQEAALRQLLEKVLTVKDPTHIPSLLSKNLELILALSQGSGAQIIDNILRETEASQDEESAKSIAEAIDLVVTFAEDFVEETIRMDSQNKNLLGSIIMVVSDKDKTASAREQALDELLEREKSRITAGFLRHLEGECQRIATAPKMTTESTRLLQILRMIQTRVLEEAGSGLGEAAQVLGQLIGYQSAAERLAVLEAGLTVRGPAFARQLLEMTEEALDGFTRVVGGADPDLVVCIEQIDQRLRTYLDGSGME
jgi:hypothetical protein